MESEMSVAVISLSIVVLCWVVVRINQKLDESVRKFYRSNDFEPEHQNLVGPDREPEQHHEQASVQGR